jgi:hypothetical protein
LLLSLAAKVGAPLTRMIISLRRVTSPPLGATIERSLYRHPSVLVRIATLRGVVVEDRLFEPLFPPSVHPGWPVLAVGLDGGGVIRQGGASECAGPGELVWAPGPAPLGARSGAGGVRALFVQWDPRVFGRAGDVRLTRARLAPADFLRLRAVADRVLVAGYDAAAASRAVAGLFALLRGLGFLGAEPSPGDLLAPIPPEVARAGAAVDSALSNLSAKPMALDVEDVLERSPAQARRILARYGEALRLQGARNWRDLRSIWRLYVGCALMTSKGATTEHVAALLGYGSPAAFCHAFANAGLPAPSDVRAKIDALR